MPLARLFPVVLALVLVACSCAGALAQTPSPRTKREPLVRHEPMIFFVARGARDACGPGCSKWIAAEGTFDPQVHVRLRQFLSDDERRRLPIFFHSPGGELQPSMAAGLVLREFRMTAGIGQTLPEGCRDGRKADAACRKLMQSGRELNAQLRIARGICASGCAYALVGASRRLIGEGARFGVHASRVVARPDAPEAARTGAALRRSAESQSYDILRHYVTLAGVDPGLIDLAIRTPHQTVHWLSRDELTRYGLVSGEFFETRWFRHPKPDGGVFIMKSVTQAAPAQRGAYRTLNIGIDCSANNRAFISLRRELAASERDPASLKLSSGEAFVVMFGSARRQGDTDLHVQPVSPDALVRAANADKIVFREEKDAWSREFTVSTQGLREALGGAPGRCGGHV